MTNNVKDKGVKITLDKERTMLFDLNALCELEDSYDSVFDAFEDIQKMKMKSIRSILHASLAHEDDSLTLKDVGKLVNTNNVHFIVEKLTQALNESSPEVNETEVTKKAKNE